MICEDSPILKVCPFCYADAYVSIQKHYDKPYEVQIICTKCGCRCRPFPVQNNRPGGVAETVAEAAKHWNSSYIDEKSLVYFDTEHVHLDDCPLCSISHPRIHIDKHEGVCIMCDYCGARTPYFSDDKYVDPEHAGYSGALWEAVFSWNTYRSEACLIYSKGKADVRYE